MDPKEFCLLAEELVHKESRPVDCRTAISRAYYSVYNHGKLILNNLGISIPRDGRGHRILQDKLSNSGVDEIVEVGSMLANLYTKRRHADYDMNRRDVEKRNNATLNVVLARKMLISLDKCKTDPIRSIVTGAIKKYEDSIRA